MPGTTPSTLELTPATDDGTVAVRRIGFRCRDAHLDGKGDLTIYPVVRTPQGLLYAGFERTYSSGSIGRRWLYWDFPTQFRSPESRVRTEQQADFGDHLLDLIFLGTAAPGTLLPSGTYQVKWIVNNALVDNGDRFRYRFRISDTDR